MAAELWLVFLPPVPSPHATKYLPKVTKLSLLCPCLKTSGGCLIGWCKTLITEKEKCVGGGGILCTVCSSFYEPKTVLKKNKIFLTFKGKNSSVALLCQPPSLGIRLFPTFMSTWPHFTSHRAEFLTPSPEFSTTVLPNKAFPLCGIPFAAFIHRKMSTHRASPSSDARFQRNLSG